MATTETALTRKPVIEAINKAKDAFQGRLPKGMTAERFIFGLMTTVQKNPDLLECEPQSVLLAAYEAAECGLDLTPSRQLGYIIPYFNKEIGKKQAQFQPGYRGMIQVAYRTGQVKTFFAEVVYEKDVFKRIFAPRRSVIHEPAEGDRGNRIGAYALIEFENGDFDFEYLTAAQIEVHRKHSKKPDSLMWGPFWEEAWRKTPMRILFKRVPIEGAEMDKLAEVIANDAERDLELEPAGRMEREPDAPPLASLLPKANIPSMEAIAGGDVHVPAREPGEDEAPTMVSGAAVRYYVGPLLTYVQGNTIPLLSAFKSLGAKLNDKTKQWSFEASRTHEFLDSCDLLNVSATETDRIGNPLPKAKAEQGSLLS